MLIYSNWLLSVRCLVKRVRFIYKESGFKEEEERSTIFMLVRVMALTP